MYTTIYVYFQCVYFITCLILQKNNNNNNINIITIMGNFNIGINYLD